jgi:molecular chaperone DnaJ
MARDYYEILGLSKDATTGQIRAAYRKLSRKWHPDVNPGNREAEERFKEISSAYEVLGNEEKRKLYDEFGEESLRPGFNPEGAREYRQYGGRPRGGGGEEEEHGRFHTFEDLFGSRFDFGFGKGGYTSPQAYRGSDIESGMTIDFIASLRGMNTEVSLNKAHTCPTCRGTGSDPTAGETTCTACGGTGRLNVARGPVEFTKTCPRCGGSGRVGRECPTCLGDGIIEGLERIRLSIPAGVKEGFRLKLTGKGEPGGPRGKPGDLYITIHVAEHPFLHREDDDLAMDVPITVREAIEGGTITVPTVEGQIKVKVPRMSQSGQRLKVKGKGAVNPKTKVRGDLYMRLLIKVPRTESREAVEAAQKIDSLYRENVRADIRL